MSIITSNPGSANLSAPSAEYLKNREFNPNDYVDWLEPSPKKEANKYICPICGDHNLGIDPKGTDYSCFSTGCDRGEIKVALKKLAGSFVERGERGDRGSNHLRIAPRSKAIAHDRPKAIAFDRFELKVANFPKLSTPSFRCPDWAFDPPLDFKILGYVAYSYSPHQRVLRYQGAEGRKEFRPFYLTAHGEWKAGAGESPWPLYGSVLADSWVLAVEGEKDVDTALALGIPAVCPRGKASKTSLPGLYAKLKTAGVLGVVVIADNDDGGGGSAAIAVESAHSVGLPAFSIQTKELWSEAHKKADLTDYLKATQTPLEKLHQQISEFATAQINQMRAEAEAAKPGRSLIDTIDELIDQNLVGSQMDAAILELSKETRHSPREIKAIVSDRQVERDRLSDRAEAISQINRHQIAQKSAIDLYGVFPKPLAEAINHLSRWLNLRPETYAFTLLATVSSLQKNGTTLELLQATDYEITPALYTGIVAPPSQKKSPIIRAAATKPLQRLHETAGAHLQAQLEDWKIRCAAAIEKNEEQPPEPQRRLYSFTNTTGEAIMRQAARQPDSGLLYLCDELKSLFNSANSYRSGKGSDIEDILRYYDGDGGKVLRSDGLRDDVATFNFGIVGGIQPEVLRGLMGNGDDVNGQWSRFMFVNQPIAENIITSSKGGSVDMTGLLESAYRRIDSLPPMQYKLSSDADKAYLNRRNDYERLRCSDPRPAMSAYYGKSDGRIGKVAMNLHVLNWAINGPANSVPSNYIDLWAVQAAIAMVDFSIAQIEAIYSDMQPTTESVAPAIVKILEGLELRGELKPRDVYSGFGRRFDYGKGQKSKQVIEWFTEIEQMGFARLEKDGASVKLCKKDDSSGIPEIQKSVIIVIKSPEPLPTAGFVDDKPVINPVINPDPVINLKIDEEQIDDSFQNDDRLMTVSSTDEIQAQSESQPFDDNDDNDDSPIFINPAPTAIKASAGIKDKDGKVSAWFVTRATETQYHLRQAGSTSHRKKIAIAEVAEDHLVYQL